jgi:hypothetical protein
MLAHGEGGQERRSFLKKRTKRLLLMLSRTMQAAPTPELAKLACFFSAEKKSSLSRVSNTQN